MNHFHILCQFDLLYPCAHAKYCAFFSPLTRLRTAKSTLGNANLTFSQKNKKDTFDSLKCNALQIDFMTRTPEYYDANLNSEFGTAVVLPYEVSHHTSRIYVLSP